MHIARLHTQPRRKSTKGETKGIDKEIAEVMATSYYEAGIIA